MKSPEYVRDVARIYRRLLDESRGASKAEMTELAEVFSRGGFTDGYFTRRIDSTMLGVRSEADKQSSRELEPFVELTKKIALRLEAEILRGKPCVLRVASDKKRVEYVSDILPMDAINAPLTCENVKKQLSRLGSTSYEASEIEIKLDDGLMIPVSQLNKLRRDAIEAFEREDGRVEQKILETTPDTPKNKPIKLRTAVFASPEQITEKARGFFDIIFLPAHKHISGVNGVALPPVIFDSEKSEVEKILKRARENGAEYALVGNLGHIELAKKYGFRLCADMRLNIFNNSSAALSERLGFEFYIASPELGTPQTRDMDGARLAVVYGRLPLMLLEKCVGKELGGCEKCEDGKIALKDRRGISFPVLKEWQHRSVVYNSLPTCMSDKLDILDKNRIFGQHFIFSTESYEQCDSVISAFERGIPLDGKVRRMGSALGTGV